MIAIRNKGESNLHNLLCMDFTSMKIQPMQIQKGKYKTSFFLIRYQIP